MAKLDIAIGAPSGERFEKGGWLRELKRMGKQRCFHIDDIEACLDRTRKRVIDKTGRLLQLLTILRVGQSRQSLPPSGHSKQIISKENSP